MLNRFYFKVVDYQPELLPKPVLKSSINDLRVESLDELEVITVTCELNEV